MERGSAVLVIVACGGAEDWDSNAVRLRRREDMRPADLQGWQWAQKPSIDESAEVA